MTDDQQQPKLHEIGFKCLPGKSWEYTAGVVHAALEKTAAQLVEEREWSAVVGAEILRLREQLQRANETIDTFNREN